MSGSALPVLRDERDLTEKEGGKVTEELANGNKIWRYLSNLVFQLVLVELNAVLEEQPKRQERKKSLIFSSTQQLDALKKKKKAFKKCSYNMWSARTFYVSVLCVNQMPSTALEREKNSRFTSIWNITDWAAFANGTNFETTLESWRNHLRLIMRHVCDSTDKTYDGSFVEHFVLRPFFFSFLNSRCQRRMRTKTLLRSIWSQTTENTSPQRDTVTKQDAIFKCSVMSQAADSQVLRV